MLSSYCPINKINPGNLGYSRCKIKKSITYNAKSKLQTFFKDTPKANLATRKAIKVPVKPYLKAASIFTACSASSSLI
jgi:hypothetical protein